MPGARGHELLFAGELDLHRPPGGFGKVGGDVLDEHLLLGTEASTDARLDHPYVLDLAIDQWREHPARVERHLGGRADHHALVRVEPCNRDVVLDGDLLYLVHAECLLEHPIGLGEALLDVSPLSVDVVDDVAFAVVDVLGVLLVVDHRGSGLHRLKLVEHGGQHLVGDVDEAQRLLGDLCGIGRHGCYSVADVPHLGVEAHLVVGMGVGPALTT